MISIVQLMKKMHAFLKPFHGISIANILFNNIFSMKPIVYRNPVRYVSTLETFQAGNDEMWVTQVNMMHFNTFYHVQMARLKICHVFQKPFSVIWTSWSYILYLYQREVGRFYCISNLLLMWAREEQSHFRLKSDRLLLVVGTMFLWSVTVNV